ncbi:hypothetical protein B2I21_27960 [Chryseobacterium mucoviscidosis]|nr:hypothetical protein B2I21_27960 [Chryseobacterium mucoviscidosis]
METGHRKFPIPASKQEMLQRLLHQRVGNTAVYTTVQPVSRTEFSPVSSAQKRLWFLDQLYPQNAFYNIPFLFRFKGELDTSALTKSLEQMVSRHESLRTTFAVEDGEPVQIIHDQSEYNWKMNDVTDLPEEQREPAAMELFQREAQTPFDLSTGPLLRSGLIRVQPNDHFFMMNIHHIVFDGWSTGVLCQELELLYRANRNGEDLPLLPLEIQYADYAHWQNEYLKGSEVQQQLSYWEEKLNGSLPILHLPYDFPSPSRQTFKGAFTTFTIPSEVNAALKQISRTYGATPFMAFLTVYKILLYRYTRQEDLVVGTPIANRNINELEDLIGFFVNTLVIRTSISSDMSFVDLLKRVQQVTLDAYANQDVPFDTIVEAIQPERNLGGTPLFQVMFNLIDDVRLSLDGLHVTPLEIDNQTSKFEMELTLIEHAEGMSGGVEYSTDRFKEDTIASLIQHYLLLLESVVQHPDVPISQLQFLSEQECQLLEQWNQTTVPYPDDICMHQYFERQVKQTPDKSAIVFKDTRLSYQELDRLSNGLAFKLREHGVGPDVCVGICMERSLEMVVAVLGVLKAGGAYVPLDPHYPQDRLIYILEDTDVPVVITQSSLLSLIGGAGTNLFVLDHIEELEPVEEVPESGVGPDHILYILYTSGSTGKPKGIVMDHRPIVNLMAWQMKNLKSPQQATVLQFSTLNFDMSCHEMFSAFGSGGTVILVDEQTRKNPESLLELIVVHKVQRLHLPYISFQQLAEVAEQIEGIEYEITDITVSGEQLRVTPQIRNWHKKLGNCTVQNHYGPTETHVVTAFMIEDMDEVNPLPPIGRAIDNCEIYILDNELQPVPVGVYGELYIGGICLARGYLNREELTADRFIPNPFADEPGQRMYKSGDLARFLPSGDVEFLGRMDEQVKIRGFRVEPGEVESVISTYPGVRETVVVAYQEQQAPHELVAYVVVDQEDIVEPELREHLKKKLPDYMLPTIFMKIEEMPLTPSGKVSRSALPQPKRNMGGKNKTAPVTAAEKGVAAIWVDILECEEVGLEDQFFELGGHSLLAIKVISRIRSAFQTDLPLYTIFEFPQLSDFAAHLVHYLAQHEGLSSESESIVPVPREPYMPLSYAQERIWFFEQWQQDSSMYNISKALHVMGELDEAALEQSYQQLIERHESLRTNFVDQAGLPKQMIHPFRSLSIRRLDLRNDVGERQYFRLQALIAEEEQQPFDLANDPLIRTSLYRLDDEEWVLLLVVHHIIFDDWSMSLLEQEWWENYDRCKQDPAFQREALSLQYVDYAIWQRNMLQGVRWEEQMGYWKNQLQGKLPILQLPTDRPRPAQQSYKGAHVDFTIDRRLAEKARQFSKQENVSLYMTLLTTFKALLYRYTGEQDLLVGSPMTNRNRTEWEQLIGFFVNTLVLRTSMSSEMTWKELLSSVKRVTMEAFSHQEIPFEKLVQELQPERSQGFSPIFQVMFSLQNTQHVYDRESLKFSPYNLENINSLFDISMFIEEEQELQVTIEYGAALFERGTIERFAQHYSQLLESMLQQPEKSIAQATLLTEQERRQLLVDWNDTARSGLNHRAQEQDIYQQFSQAVLRHPHAVAIEDGERTITYEELQTQAQAIACMLRDAHTEAGTVIGLYMERSIELVASMLGTLKVGACFVPVDPEYPAERIRWMVENSRMPIVLTRSDLMDSLPIDHDCVVAVDKLQGIQVERVSQEEAGLPSKCISMENTAYVIYTSGSTGKPKGVMISQRSLADHVQTVIEGNRLNDNDRIVQFSAISFDFSIHEMFPALLVGATLVLRPKSVLDTHEFVRWLNVKEISVLYLPTAYWHLLVSEWDETDAFPASMKLVSVGGEKASIALYEKWKQITQGRIRWSNAYGPTEATVAATTFYDDMDKLHEAHEDLPIGRPLPNTQLYILDHLLQPVPIGVAGELFIGGVRLAQGYLNQPELTDKAFIPHPFQQGERLYQTGDYVRYREDGQIEYIGRKDSQVKIRGYRVELGEIEVCLEQLPQVEQALVTVRDDLDASGQQLVAYVKCKNGEAVLDTIRHDAKQLLPSYMQPSFYVTLKNFPFTAGGKINRALLPKPDVFSAESAGSRQPANETEERLSRIWCQLLQRKGVGTKENFFEIGGHSLLATQMNSLIRKEFSKNVPIKAIFDSPTIMELAQIISSIEAESKVEIPKISRMPRGTKA